MAREAVVSDEASAVFSASSVYLSCARARVTQRQAASGGQNAFGHRWWRFGDILMLISADRAATMMTVSA